MKEASASSSSHLQRLFWYGTPGTTPQGPLARAFHLARPPPQPHFSLPSSYSISSLTSSSSTTSQLHSPPSFNPVFSIAFLAPFPFMESTFCSSLPHSLPSIPLSFPHHLPLTSLFPTSFIDSLSFSHLSFCPCLPRPLHSVLPFPTSSSPSSIPPTVDPRPWSMVR